MVRCGYGCCGCLNQTQTHPLIEANSTNVASLAVVKRDSGETSLADWRRSFVADEPSARVWGSVRRGAFEGVIESDRAGTFFVEDAAKYFGRHNASRAGFHSVIYRDEDVVDPHAPVRRGHATGCGLSDRVEAWMAEVQGSAVPEAEPEAEPEPECEREQHYLPPEYQMMADTLASHRVGQDALLKSKYDRLARQLKKDLHDKYSAASNSRAKRSLLGVGADNRGTCTLSIQTDPMLWHHIHDKVSSAVLLSFLFLRLREVGCCFLFPVGR